MKIAYFDCYSGASGDMVLGALMDAGLELETLREETAKLRINGYELHLKKIIKMGICGSQALILLKEAQTDRQSRPQLEEDGHAGHGHPRPPKFDRHTEYHRK